MRSPETYFTGGACWLSVEGGMATVVRSRQRVYRVIQGQAASMLIKRWIETDFDEEDFLDGAKDAFFMGDPHQCLVS